MNIDINIQNKKLELIQWLCTLEDLSIINKIFDKKKKKPIGGTRFQMPKKIPLRKV